MSTSLGTGPARRGRARFLRALAALQAVLIGLVSAALLWGDRRSTEASPPRAAAEKSAVPQDDVSAEPGAPVAVDAGSVEPERPLEAAAPASTVLFGRVLGSSRHWRLSVARMPSGGEVATAFGSLDVPDYAVPALGPGRYRARIDSSGRRPVDAEFEVPAGLDRMQRDFRLETTWKLKVALTTPEGKPLLRELQDRRDVHPYWSMPSVLGTPDAPPPVLPSFERRQPAVGVGRWVDAAEAAQSESPLPKRYAGYLELLDLQPLHVSVVLRSAVLATAPVEAGQDDVQLTVDVERVLASMCTVLLQIVDAGSGKPLPGARAALVVSGSGGPEARADAEGRVELRSVPGLFYLGVGSEDRVAGSLRITLEPGARIDLGKIPLQAPVELRLKFTGLAAGAEVNGWLQRLGPAPHPALQPGSFPLSWSRAKDGVWSSTLVAGRYLLRATAGGAGAVMEVEARAGAEPIVVPMQPEAKLRVVPLGGGRSVELALVGAAGHDLYRQWITWSGAYDVCLPLGAYMAQVTRLDGKRDQRPVQVPSSGGVLDLRQ